MASIGGESLGGAGEPGVGLVEVPGEGPAARALAPDDPEGGGEHAWRQGGDQPLEAAGQAEGGRVRGGERAVAPQRLLPRPLAGVRGADLPPRRDAEVEGRPDALAREREAVPGRVAREED